jgi:hypothetical protein
MQSTAATRVAASPPPLLGYSSCCSSLLQVHHRLFVCSSAHQQKSNTTANTTVINITPGSERLSASGLNVTHVVSQSDVIKLLWANKTVLGAALAATVEALELDAVRVAVNCLTAVGFRLGFLLCLGLGFRCCHPWVSPTLPPHCPTASPSFPLCRSTLSPLP